MERFPADAAELRVAGKALEAQIPAFQERIFQDAAVAKAAQSAYQDRARAVVQVYGEMVNTGVLLLENSLLWPLTANIVPPG